MKIQNTITPYKTIDDNNIQYGVCRDFEHISRYRGLRQVTHRPNDISNRYVALETTNPFTTHSTVKYYQVPASEENRLDIIANKFLGSATYSWVLANFNHIEDGYTVTAGQVLQIPESITTLFKTGEMLAPISPNLLNLGEE